MPSASTHVAATRPNGKASSTMNERKSVAWGLGRPRKMHWTRHRAIVSTLSDQIGHAHFKSIIEILEICICNEPSTHQQCQEAHPRETAQAVASALNPPCRTHPCSSILRSCHHRRRKSCHSRLMVHAGRMPRPPPHRSTWQAKNIERGGGRVAIGKHGAAWSAVGRREALYSAGQEGDRGERQARAKEIKTQPVAGFPVHLYP